MNILERLDYKNGRIFEIELMDNKDYVLLTDAVDLYFNVMLDRNDMNELIHEFTALRQRMDFKRVHCRTCQNDVSKPCGKGCDIDG